MNESTNPSRVLFLRITPDLRDRIAQHATRLRKDLPGINVSDASAARDLIERGLSSCEGKH